MSWPLSDEQLTGWAREHLVYEGRMLAFAVVRLAERQGLPPDPESNALLDSFVVHVRCLRDFLWRDRGDGYRTDAFAADFCEADDWAARRGDLPPALLELDDRKRAGRELAHLSYQRSSIDSADKSWDCGEIYDEIAHGLGVFAEIAAPSRVDDDTRAALKDLLAHTPPCGSASVATGAVYGIAIERGGIEFAFRPGS